MKAWLVLSAGVAAIISILVVGTRGIMEEIREIEDNMGGVAK